MLRCQSDLCAWRLNKRTMSIWKGFDLQNRKKLLLLLIKKFMTWTTQCNDYYEMDKSFFFLSQKKLRKLQKCKLRNKVTTRFSDENFLLDVFCIMWWINSFCPEENNLRFYETKSLLSSNSPNFYCFSAF